MLQAIIFYICFTINSAQYGLKLLHIFVRKVIMQYRPLLIRGGDVDSILR